MLTPPALAAASAAAGVIGAAAAASVPDALASADALSVFSLDAVRGYHPAALALLVFCLRILDVSVGTVRVIYTVRGQRLVSAVLGVLESGIWIFAISRVLGTLDHPASMIGWALGFGAGTAVGISVEAWMASGSILARVISIDKPIEVREALLERGFGVTALPGEGRGGGVLVLFVVAPRRRGRELVRLTQRLDPAAFITIDPVRQAIGGYFSATTTASATRK